MGGRGQAYDFARGITGQYSLQDVTGSKSKVVSFYRSVRNRGGAEQIAVRDGKIKISRDAYNQATETANYLTDNAVMRNEDAIRDYNGIRAALRGSYSISRQDRSSIADFGKYARSNENHVRISNRSGISIDQKYEELSSQYPAYFDPSRVLNPADRLKDINRVLNGLKSQRTVPFPDEWRSDMSSEIRNQLIRGYVMQRRRYGA